MKDPSFCKKRVKQGNLFCYCPVCKHTALVCCVHIHCPRPQPVSTPYALCCGKVKRLLCMQLLQQTWSLFSC